MKIIGIGEHNFLEQSHKKDHINFINIWDIAEWINANQEEIKLKQKAVAWCTAELVEAAMAALVPGPDETLTAEMNYDEPYILVTIPVRGRIAWYGLVYVDAPDTTVINSPLFRLHIYHDKIWLTDGNLKLEVVL